MGDPDRYRLPDDIHERILREEILPERLTGAVAQDQPMVVFVAGQPGAGKTATAQLVRATLDRRGGAVHISGDFYKPYHPDYLRLLSDDPGSAGAHTRHDYRRWLAEVEAHVRERRFHAVVEIAPDGPGEFVDSAALFRAAGYRIEAALLAVPEALSRLGIVDRYARQSQQGLGRFTSRAGHDACYYGLPATADRIDAQRLVDTVFVLRRGNQPLYRNHLTVAGGWSSPPRAREAIVAERLRPWTQQETQAFYRTLQRLAAQTGPQLGAELADIAALASHRFPDTPTMQLNAGTPDAVTPPTSPGPARPRPAPELGL